jgi:hypothetical protein
MKNRNNRRRRSRSTRRRKEVEVHWDQKMPHLLYVYTQFEDLYYPLQFTFFVIVLTVVNSDGIV